MATLKTIRKRIGSISNTKKLTRAMKMIAASKLKKAQSAAIAAREYEKELSRIVSSIAAAGNSISNPLFEKSGEIKKVDLIVLSSDKGLCGAFNEHLIGNVEKFIKQRRSAGVDVNVVIFGKKGKDYFKRAGEKPIAEFVHVPDKEVFEIVQKQSLVHANRFIDGTADEVIIAYNSFKSAGNYKLTFLNLLPVAPLDIKMGYGIDYIYEPSKKEVIDWLVANMVTANLHMAILESKASEIAARMMAMDLATSNAEDLINTLTIQLNKARQSSITTELIDIVGGAEAMK